MPQATRGVPSLRAGNSILRNLDQRGATAIEYALLIALIAVAGTTAFILAGSQSRATMTTVASSLDASKTLDLPAPAAPPAP